LSANEIDPYAIAAIRLNAAANARELQPYQWEILLVETVTDADVVLAGGTCSTTATWPRRLLRFLRAGGATGARLCWPGDPGRAYVAGPTDLVRGRRRSDVPGGSAISRTSNVKENDRVATARDALAWAR